MDEQRMTAYLNLIQSLLTCPDGEEVSLLQANAELVDEEFVQIMVVVAAQMAEAGNENAANWLLKLAAKLAEMLGISSTSPPATLLQGKGGNTPHFPSGEGRLAELGYTSVTLKYYLNFLIFVLQIVEDDNRPQSIYPLLQNNLDKLNDKLAHILTAWAKETLAKLESEVAKSLAETILSFSNLMGQFTLGNIASNKEIAIAGYQAVVPIFSQSDFPQDWAIIQNNLANAYSDRIRGDRAENLEAAIAHYDNALLVYTQSDFPQ
ncbi:MAG: tetratricopeptide repeat protein, partial [Coleofasciculus sp. C2-GNP5-27]